MVPVTVQCRVGGRYVPGFGEGLLDGSLNHPAISSRLQHRVKKEWGLRESVHLPATVEDTVCACEC